MPIDRSGLSEGFGVKRGASVHVLESRSHIVACVPVSARVWALSQARSGTVTQLWMRRSRASVGSTQRPRPRGSRAPVGRREAMFCAPRHRVGLAVVTSTALLLGRQSERMGTVDIVGAEVVPKIVSTLSKRSSSY